MRFAWFRDQRSGYVSQVQPFPHPAFWSRLLYNAVFWVFLLPFVTPMSYGTAFLVFIAVIAFRAARNVYHNNVMPQTPEAFDRSPLRIPL